MSQRAWAIKLGSGGRCVPFCEKHSIVGIGWKDVDTQVVAQGSRDTIYEALKAVERYRGSEGSFGQWTGALYRFGRECTQGDYISYYDPTQKRVQICRVISELLHRDFDLNAQDLETTRLRKRIMASFISGSDAIDT